ncbi:AAA family ATPase [Sphingomonas naphthae]|uniref:AAA family ATPase n=1 Tax=Sphingomonas naphthae TaxID=1813468 RepID=A0ABY7TP44_9SPHN|nr:AAA family ATPase [Sphingomonas naphthae]WCT75004.1 AAA family ATPase [Sphingomonas naphthae]
MSGLVGHEAAVAAFLDALSSDRLHHAWLLAGPQGVGKARFAEAAALRLLADAAGPPVRGDTLAVPEEHRIARLMAAGSHPDYRRLARLEKDKTGDLARSITVDQVRGLPAMFATTPSLSPRRVIVIDAIDDMERGGANALLKNLEEPPQGTIFLLVSHAPGRLLPTIRSRCRLLRFQPLDDGQTATVLTRELGDAAEAQALTRIAAGAPGAAMRFAGLDVPGMDAALDRLAREGDASNAGRIALARTLSLKAAQPRYEAFLERAPARIAIAARGLSGGPLAHAIDLWQRARTVAEVALRTSGDSQATVFELAGLVAALAPAPERAKG